MTCFPGGTVRTMLWTMMVGGLVACGSSATKDDDEDTDVTGETDPDTDVDDTDVADTDTDVADTDTDTDTDVVDTDTDVDDTDVDVAFSLDAGPPQEVDEGVVVTLAGTTAPLTGTIDVTWTQTSGPSVVLATPDALSTTFTAPAVPTGTLLVFTLERTDGGVVVASDDTSVLVRSTNQPPVADAGADLLVDEATSVQLAGTASDPDGTVVSTVWTQVGGLAVSLADATTLQPSFSAPVTASGAALVFRLDVTDDDGAVSSDEVLIEVAALNEAPVVEAGDPQVVDEGDLVTLDGSASDADGSVASTEWTQIAGPTVSLSDASVLAPTFTAPSSSTNELLGFQLEATDDEGATATDITWVTVATTNLPPVADAGSDVVADEQTAVTLVGGATDADGTVVSVQWAQVAGPPVTLTDSDTLAPSLLTPATLSPAALVFRLTVVDDDGAIDVDEAVITVLPLNDPPLVTASAAQVVDEGDTVGLLGTATDPDGTIASTLWTQIAGPMVALSDAQSLTPTFTAPAVTADTLLGFRLDATDDEGALSYAVAWVTVINDNQPPIADAGPDLDVDEGVQVTLQGTVGDPDGSVAALQWAQVGGPATGLDDIGIEDPTLTTPAVTRVETLVYRLTVTDDEGASSSDTVSVRVSPLNAPPEANAGQDQTVSGGELVQLSGAATDTDGTIASTTWSEIGSSLVSLSDDSVLDPTFTAPDASFPTDIVLELRVVDDEGAVDTDRMVVSIQPLVAVNQPPTVYAGADQQVGSGSAVTLSGSASDADGTIASTTWTQVSGPDVLLDDDTALSTGFSAPEVGCAVLLVFELEAVDDEGATSTDRMTVLVTGSGTTGTLSYPASFDLDADDGGLTSEGTVWEYGTPTTGPGAPYSGSRVWATNLDGNYGLDQFEVLCLPPIDLSTATDPLLTFRRHLGINSGDVFVVQGLDPAQGWVSLTDAEPPLTRLVGDLPSWGGTGATQAWWLTAVRLPEWLGSEARLRFLLRTDGAWVSTGAYVDDVRIEDDGSDPDADGISGILHEWLDLGLDPYVADVDGDGADDGDEILAGTDPENPADFPGQGILTPGFLFDFEADDGGLVAGPGPWEHGGVASGPGRAHSGTQAWATNLSGSYGHHHRAYLNLPPVDLSGTTAPTLAFRLWSAINSGDGLSVEAYDADDGVWRAIQPHTPAYTSTDALGLPAWKSYGYRTDYVLAALPLDAFVGETVFLRLSFRTDGAWLADGAYVDDLAIFDESADPDGDGVLGVLGEIALGTDPFVGDTDGDGVLDGTEVSDGTDPLDPVSWSGAPTLVPGDHVDFESGASGLVASAPDWAWGVFASGPGTGWSGTSGWATNLSGNFAQNGQEYLYLPPVDLTATMDPTTLSFRLWLSGASGDGLSLERYDDLAGWVTLHPDTPAYDSTDAAGRPAWRYQTTRTGYLLAAVALDPWLGETLRLRFAWRTDGAWTSTGAYLDDLAVDLETSDPDGDGVVGILDEYFVHGTDPYVADSDADGFDDGVELGAGVDPLNPAHHPAAVSIVDGDAFDFELDDGGFVADGPTWQWGNPASGPGVAWSGSRVWATNLSGAYASNRQDRLLFPPVDLTASVRPTLSFRLWMDGHNGDGMGLDAQDPSGAWTRVLADAPVAYESVDASGVVAFRDLTADGDYVLVTMDLSAWVGLELPLRLMFRSDGGWQSSGAYVDDIRLDEETSDPDGDGLVGIADERQLYGTDPFLADTDGDGADDDVEVGLGTDPLDPDSDGDGVDDGTEIGAGTDPLDPLDPPPAP